MFNAPGLRKLFGFRIGQTKSNYEENPQKRSIASPSAIGEGAVVITHGGSGAVTGAYLNGISLDHIITDEVSLITTYRDLSLQSDVDAGISQIVNDAIVIDENAPPVSLTTDDIPYSDEIKKRLQKEFNEILSLLNFRRKGYDIFRRWYVDGRIYYHIILDSEHPDYGIIELRQIDPRVIKKVVEVRKEKDLNSGADVIAETMEYYVYNPSGVPMNSGAVVAVGTKVSCDSICFAHSGLVDASSYQVLSFLHKAIKPANQLRMMEDSEVIYRITRAPEKLMFFIDVGNLPPNKAEAYVNEQMTKFKNKVIYDPATGEIRDDRRMSTLTENYWLPRREGSKGTEITTLPGGQGLGEFQFVDYFKKNLYLALNIPRTRLDSEKGFSIGKSTEITRDEVNFAKFINRLRVQFSSVFDQLLRVQLISKKICTQTDWEEKIKPNIGYNFQSDSYFSELKEIEIMTNRLELVDKLSQYTGKYFSDKYIRKVILKQTDLEIEEMDAEMAEGKVKKKKPEPEETVDTLDDEPVEQEQEPEQGQDDEQEPI